MLSWQYGDCARTAIASILNLDIDVVPHFLYDGTTDGALFRNRLLTYLARHGLYGVDIPFAATVNEVLGMMGVLNPDVYYLLSVGSPLANHLVVAKGAEIVNDPAGYDPTELGPCDDGYVWVTILAVNNT